MGVCDGQSQSFAVGEIAPDAFKALVTPNGGETFPREIGRTAITSPK